MPYRLTVEIFASVLLVAAVFWFMWRMPKKGEAFFGWAPRLAFLSAWGGLLGLVGSVLLWVVRHPDQWLVVLFLALDPAAIAAGVLVLWIYGGRHGTDQTIDLQTLQAKVGITLALIAVVVGYAFVHTHV